MVARFTSPLPRTAPPGIPVAVPPLKSFSPDPADERLCAGLTADLAAGLARFRGLRVTSDPDAVGRGYVVIGTLRRAGERVRLQFQLCDAEGRVIWSERLDGHAGDTASRADAVATLCGRLADRIEACDRHHAVRLGAPAADARRLVLLGREELGGRYTREANLRARYLFMEAAVADPGYGPAFAGLSRTYNRAWMYGWEDESAGCLERAVELAQAAVDRDRVDARGHAELAFARLYRKESEAALISYARAAALNPNDPDILVEHAIAFTCVGEDARSLELLERAMRLNPRPPDWYLWHLADVLDALDRPDEVVTTLRRMGDMSEGRRLLAATYARLGLIEAARAEAREVLRLHPGFTIAAWMRRLPYRGRSSLDRFAEGLRRAGLP